jgi:hypothetical protein
VTRTLPRARRRVLAAATLASAAVLAGCGIAPSEIVNYPASDGVDLTLGSLQADNLLVLTAAENDPGVLLGALTNNGDQAMTVRIGLPDSPTTVPVAAHSTTLLGPDHTAVDLSTVPAAPGALVELAVDSDVSGNATLQVPVLDGTLPAYSGMVPQG